MSIIFLFYYLFITYYFFSFVYITNSERKVQIKFESETG